MKRSFSDDELRAAGAKIDPALTKFMSRFPGESGARQPVHTVYGGAHLFRIDFEDGYGNRADAEEDAHAAAAAREVAAGMKNGTLPPFIGIRIKQFSQELMPRAMRTMDIFISTLIEDTGALPPNFVVTLP